MTRWRADPDGAADQLIVECLDDLALPADGSILLADAGPRLESALGSRAVTSITRRLRMGGSSGTSAWPDASSPFHVGLLRLPKDKHELVMTAHLMSARLTSGASLLVHGGNDEGIRSAATHLTDVGAVETVAARHHGRVLRVHIDTPSPRGSLDDWRETHRIVIGTERDWIAYPGTFARGGLDPATALLIDTLAIPSSGARVLDFACGTGIIGAALLARTADLDLCGIDNDALALRAAAQNVPDASWQWGTSLAAVGEKRFDLIVSNPPFHIGVREDLSIMDALVTGAPRRLTPNGQLWLVSQRRFALEPQLRKHFATVAVAADDGRFRVWSASRPLKRQPARR